MFALGDSQKTSFIEQTKAARQERAQEKKKENAVVKVQSQIRGWMARKKYRKQILQDFDGLITPNTEIEGNQKFELKSNTAVYHVACRFLSVFNAKQLDHVERLERLCRYLIASLESDSPKLNYVGVTLVKELSLSWISHIKKLLGICCEVLESLRPESHTESVSLALYLHTLVAFTSTNTWTVLKTKALMNLKAGMTQLCNNIMGGLVQKGFYKTLRTVLLKGTCRSQVVLLKRISLTGVITMSVRPLVAGNFTERLMSQYLIQILSVPAIMYNLEQLAPECITLIQQNSILEKSLQLLSDDKNLKTITENMQGTQILAFLANLVTLFQLEKNESAANLSYPLFVIVATSILNGIPGSVGLKSGTCTQWHDLLGWFAPSPDAPHNENMSQMKRQMHQLWGQRAIRLFFGDKLKELITGYEKVDFQAPPAGGNIWKRALCKSTIQTSSRVWQKLANPDVKRIARVSSLYYAALQTLQQIKLDILSGLCYSDTTLHDLWLLIASLGPYCGLKLFLDIHQSYGSNQQLVPELHMLILFCDCMTHYVTILDDVEMYEQQSPFMLTDFVALSYFLNNFLYKTIVDYGGDLKIFISEPLFVSLHTLLLCLYRRDCRRPFAPPNHWLIHDLRPSQFIHDLEKGKKHTQILLQKMPHIIPHQDRVKLFRKYVQNEKSVLGLTESACVPLTSSLITVHRERIVEDGYRQLAALPPHSLKGVIRVKFVNQQGLDEAGIDQDGVFKEFLEETIKRVFDPSLNLFKTTTDERLYPSSTSRIQENHLQLFEFVGRMLGKAVYEGIVVDVPFASFFLSQLLGQTHQALYSCMDELPSLDSELYRSLTFIKHYDGDVTDLDLTFSIDEDVMGKVITHELHPGGRALTVSNDNKINYIHYMAYFRMHTQIREQTAAFIRGFRCIVNPDWLSLFSTPELQRLISGDTSPMDLKDLRRHTQYYGGFHDSHRVIGWLWDILAKDFTEDERKLFLKFVTSCSKPPLLGFAHLEPPFSIRCVEVGDDEDTGDTIGSVIRGFFTIRKKDPLNRLPTSSTCFNLLKLPNYQKKQTLREKLRYSISSNTGFELS